MNRSIRSFFWKTQFLLFIVPLLMASSVAYATTVTVDPNDSVVVTQPAGLTQTVVTPVVITQQATLGDFEGRVVKIDYSRNIILVRDTTGSDREVIVLPALINNHRVGDYVLVHPTAEVTAITLAENPKDFEGEIIRVNIPDNQIVVLDTNGRERKVDMKKGMIGTYKVDDYVRIHLMADLKEAKTIETIRNVRNLEGNIVRIDVPQSQIVVLGADGKDSTVIVRQGQVNNYKVGDNVRVYLLENQEQVQVIRIIR